MNGTDPALVTAAIAASASIAAGVIGGLSAFLAVRRENRRKLYSEATKAAVSWKEMLYQIRRREKGQEPELVAAIHSLQDSLTYYQAWVGSESKYMCRSYNRLAEGVKAATAAPISEAWASPIRPAPGEAIKGDAHPDIDPLVDAFLRDVRGHLSPFFGRKMAVAWRNRESRSS